MTTIKEYAKTAGRSYETIREFIKKHEDELKGHFHQEGSSRYLDDEGVEILDRLRGETPVIVVNQARDQEIQSLKDQNNILKGTIIELQNEIINRDTEYKALQSKYVAMLEAKEADEANGSGASGSDVPAAGSVVSDAETAKEGQTSAPDQTQPSGSEPEQAPDSVRTALQNAMNERTGVLSDGFTEYVSAANMSFWERVRFVFRGK